ncbi:MAG: MFS transporter [Alphaproteobacteria bacterium]|nr:MFS transporter [Alphaproteobacteria bacterium]
MRKNIFLFNIYHTCVGLWLFSPLAIIYFQDICQSYSMAILVYSMICLTTSLTEIPVGVISDRLGRRTNIIFAAVFICLGMVFWALAGKFGLPMLFLGSVFRGIGASLHSGTCEAFMYETMCDLRSRKLFDKVYAKAMSYHQMGLLVSAVCGMIVTYYFPLIYLVWLSVLPAFINIFITLLLKEPKSCFDKQISPWQQIVQSFSLLLKKKKLRNYTIMRVLTSGVLLGAYRFEALYFAQLIPIYLINVVRIITHGCGYISFALVGVLKQFSFLKMLFYSNLVMAAIRAIGLALNNSLTPFLTAFYNLGYGISSTAQTTLLQKEYNKSLRATMHSLSDFIGGFSVTVIGYILGVIADLFSLRTALLVMVIAQILLAVGYNNLFKIYGKK